MKDIFLKYFNFRLAILLYFLIFFSFLTASCSDSPPVKEEKFIRVYVDIVIAQDTTNANSLQLQNIKKSVLEKYSVSEKDYNSTLIFYNSEPKRWQTFFDKAISYLEQLRKGKSS